MSRFVSRPYYGWVVVSATFATQFIGMGFVVYTFGIVLKDLAAEFSGGNRAPIIAIQTAVSVLAVLLAPILGRLVGRGWVRHLLTLGTLITGLGLVAIAQADSLAVLSVCYVGFLGIGGALLMGVAPTTVIVNWFDERRATALGVMHLGASLGGMTMAPLFGRLVEESGWRASYESLGIAAILATPLVWLLIVARPEDRGPPPPREPGAENDGPIGQTDANTSDSNARSPETAILLRRPELWLISIAAGLAFFTSSALSSHLVAYETDRGISPADAAWLISLLTGGSALGKLILGWACDRFGERFAFCCSLAGQATGVAALVFADGYAATAAAVLLTGIAAGGTMPISTALLARVFGKRSIGPVMGLMWPIAILLQMLGPITAAAVHDITGGYHLAFSGMIGALMVGALLIRMVRMPRE
jgi:MFS family permease